MEQKEHDTIGQIMSKKVRTVDVSASVHDALKLMIKYDIGSIVVTKDSKIYGIITERDITRKIDTQNNYLGQLCGKISSKPVVTINPTNESWEAFEIMLRNKIRRLPVLDKSGKLVGIVTERDLFKWILRVVYEPNLPQKIKILVAQAK